MKKLNTKLTIMHIKLFIKTALKLKNATEKEKKYKVSQPLTVIILYIFI